MPRPLQLDVVLNPIRVTEEFRDELRDAAEARGVSVSEYMREVLTDAVRRDLDEASRSGKFTQLESEPARGVKKTLRPPPSAGQRLSGP